MKTTKICGIHAASGILTHRPQDVKSVLLSASRKDERIEQIESLAKSAGIKCSRVTVGTLNQMARGVRHQGVIALCTEGAAVRQASIKAADLIDGGPDPSFLIVLDGIEDPRNLGACLRSAEAGGAHGAILPRHRGSEITETVSRTAAGSAESLPIARASNLARELDDLKEQGVWIIGLDSKASDSILELSLTEPCALVFGAEHGGLRRMTREKCDVLAKIPIAGAADSFNVSVAVGIAAFEVSRQRAAAK